MAVAYEAFFLTGHPLATYFALLAVIVFGAASWLVIAMYRRGVGWWPASLFALTLVVSSYPLLCMVETANLEIILVVLTGAALVFYVRGQLWLAAFLFAAAAALKLYPAVFLALFLTRRDVRKFIFGIVCAAGLFLLGHWITGPTIPEAFRGTQHALHVYSVIHVLNLRPAELGHDHSLFTYCKHAYAILSLKFGVITSLRSWYRWYCVVTGIGAGILFFTRIRSAAPLNQVISMSLLALMATPVSWDYRLMHLYVPWALLLLVVLDSDDLPHGCELMLGMFAVIFTAQTFLSYWVGREGMNVAIQYGAQVKLVAMIALLIAVLRFPLPTPSLMSPQMKKAD